MKICYIVAAGENYGIDIKKDDSDYVIAADAGIKYLEMINMEPDMIVGDFDSLNYVPDFKNILKLNTHKDDTDTHSAIEQGIERGYNDFVIYCGTGGRGDHTIANIQTLHNLANRGIKGKLIDKDSIYTVIKDSGIEFERAEGYVSVFSLSDESYGVNISGLLYELSDASIKNDFPLGVSNELIGKPGKISVSSGTLLIVYPRNVKARIID